MSFDLVNVTNVVISGVLTGLVYGLMALGLSVIFGVARVVNFAHGEIMTIAMYVAVIFYTAWRLDPFVALACAAGATTRLKLLTYLSVAPYRNPLVLAKTAASLDKVSNGRFILGIGPSGPQVVEGWHGVPYGRPLTRAREYVTIVRKILAREAPLASARETLQVCLIERPPNQELLPLLELLVPRIKSSAYPVAELWCAVQADAEVTRRFDEFFRERELASELLEGRAAGAVTRVIKLKPTIVL